MKNTTSFAENENGLEMSFTISIPKKSGNGVKIESMEDAHQRMTALMLDIIGAFSPRLIASLERRMSACQNNLLSHTRTVTYNDGRHICYRRNDGTEGTFNVPSFQTMQAAVKSLEKSCFKYFCTQRGFIDQTIKALLNDTEQDYSDCKGFKYSQLVSILCELQIAPLEK